MYSQRRRGIFRAKVRRAAPAGDGAASRTVKGEMLRNLLNRRVPQFVGLYLVGGWGFLEFLDWAVDRYLLSPALIDLTVAILLLMLPTVIVIAWRHGTPGPDEWKRIDAASIGVNLLVAGGVLFALFHDRELGAATTVKLLEDAQGNTVERAVPKAGFRRSVVLFDFENRTGDESLDWVPGGLVFAVSLDVSQDPFVTVTNTNEPPIREQLAEAGVAPGEPAPLSLQRNAALARGTGFFASGTVAKAGGDSLLVSTRLYETETGRLVTSHEYRTTSPMDVADRISLDLRRDVGIPEGQIEQSVDLPVRELTTDSPEAFRDISQAIGLLFSDPAAARTTAEEAVALDSTSSIAHLMVVNAALFAGDQAAARSAMQEAARYDYRLPERTRLSLQVQSAYLFEGDSEAAIRAGKYWTEVYPQDPEARRLLASIYASSGDRDGQIQQLHALLSIDSTDVDAMRSLGGAFAVEAEYDSAVAYFDKLIQRRPSDLATRLQLAGTLRAANRPDEARAELEKAAIVDPRDPDVPRQLALLDIDSGDLQAAERRLDEVRSRERTPTEQERRAGLEETIAYARGQFQRLEKAFRERLAFLDASQPHVQVVTTISNSEFLLYAAEADRSQEALAVIDSLQSTVQEPWSLFLVRPALRIHLDIGDVEAARADVDAGRRLVAQIGESDSRLASISWAEGRIAWLEDGDCRRAIENFDHADELAPRSTVFRLTRLECLTELQRWDEAERDAAWLLDRNPADGKVLVAAARLDAARGRRDAAIRRLETAVANWSQADPDYRPATEAREMLGSLRGA